MYRTIPAATMIIPPTHIALFQKMRNGATSCSSMTWGEIFSIYCKYPKRAKDTTNYRTGGRKMLGVRYIRSRFGLIHEEDVFPMACGPEQGYPAPLQSARPQPPVQTGSGYHRIPVLGYQECTL